MQRVEGAVRALLATGVKAYSDTIWLTDVDDTLIDTATMHNEASSSIVSVLGRFVGDEKARQVVARFEEIFEILIESLHSDQSRLERPQHERDDLLRRIAAYQREIAVLWGTTKTFSRETLLKIAAEDYGIDLTSEQVQQCVDFYWRHIELHPLYLDDAIGLTQDLAKAGLPLFLMTSSDGRLTLQQNGQFDYDPILSRRFKEERVEKLRAGGLCYRGVFVGETIDKPSREFFQFVYEGMERNLGRRLNPQHIVVMGDSYTSDIQVPVLERQARLGILYRAGQEEITIEHDRVVSVGNWSAVRDFLASSD